MTNEILTRECEVRIDQNTTHKRMIRVSFSSEASVTRRNGYGEAWIETLGHSAEEVNLSRLNTGAPVLYNHERGSNKNRIGVVERAWIENGRGYADLRISKRAEVEGIWQDIQDGILRNVSVAYQIDKKELIEKRKEENPKNNEPDLYRVTNWTPIEISFVDIPADHTVGVGRKFDNLQEEKQPKNEGIMTNENIEITDDTEIRGAPPLKPKPAIDIEAIRRDILLQEEERRAEVRNLFRPFQAHNTKSVDELLVRCLDDHKINEREAKDLLLSHLGSSLETNSKEPSISIIPGFTYN